MQICRTVCMTAHRSLLAGACPQAPEFHTDPSPSFISVFASSPITWIATPHLPTYCGQDLQKADLIMSQGQVHMPAEGGAHTICLLSLCCEPACTISTSRPLPSAQQRPGLCWPGILPALQHGSPASDNLLLVLQRWAEKGSRVLNSLHWIPE